MSTLERAVAIAAEAHAGQVDKAGEPYLLHPLRVMLALATQEARIVGVLHDVVEDCPGWTFDRLRAEGFSEAVLAGLDAVTKREGEDYEVFVRRAAQDPIGRQVKRADLIDNSDMARIAAPTARDHARLARYRKALDDIGALEASEAADAEPSAPASPEAGLLPLFTITLDDQPLCVARARDHLDALRLAEPLTATRFGGTDMELVAGAVLTLPQQTRLSVRAPTTGEIAQFDRRSGGEAPDAAAVVLL